MEDETSNPGFRFSQIFKFFNSRIASGDRRLKRTLGRTKPLTLGPGFAIPRLCFEVRRRQRVLWGTKPGSRFSQGFVIPGLGSVVWSLERAKASNFGVQVFSDFLQGFTKPKF